MKRKPRRLVQSVRNAGLPEEVIFGVPKVILMGEERVLIENHKGIVEYGKERVRVRTVCGLLEIIGTGLSLNHLGASDLLVQGKVSQLGYGAQQ